MTAGGSQSKSGGSNSSYAGSQSTQDVWGAQAPFLASLYGQAQQYAQPGQVQGAAQNANAQTQGGVLQGFNTLAGMTDQSANVAAQTAQLQAGLGDMWNKQMLPQIAGQSVGSGAFGGARQGVAQGEAAGQLASAFTQGLSGIQNSASANALNAARALPGYAGGMGQLAVAPYQAGLDQLKGFGAILGGPTVLGQSNSAGGSTGNQTSMSQGFQMGGK